MRLGDMVFGRCGAACWGTATMSLCGAFGGVAPTERRAEVSFFWWFTFADDVLASERFFFDLASLRDGIGAPVHEMLAALAPLRAPGVAVAAG